MLTQKEMDAIRFYQGDTRKRAKDGTFLEGMTEIGFYGIRSAYRTMNCLMFDGIDNEEERIAEGTADLNPQIFLEIEKVAEVFCDLFGAMCKCRRELDKDDSHRKRYHTVYRTDRGVSIQEMKKLGRTISFISTSKENELNEYFCKKKGLSLLEIVVSPEVPYLDFEQILGTDYHYADQREVLLPPFLNISLHEGKLTDKETEYKDADGNPPKGKYILVLEGLDLGAEVAQNVNMGPTLGELAEDKEKIALILKKMTEKSAITEQEKEQYCHWKTRFRKMILAKFRDIENAYREQGRTWESRKNMLMKEVKKRISEFDACRRKYKKHMRICNITLVTAGVVPMACISLSFIQDIEMLMKIATVITSAVAMLLTRILKIEVYHVKLYQRTKTCLSLRDLFRQMTYENNWEDSKVNEYVQQFQKIMNEDTNVSLQNVQLQIEGMGEFYQNDILS